MKLKSLLFGSAAVIAAGTGAQAADLPIVEPVEYVRICDAFGERFYYIPGTDTCLRVGGQVRVEAHYADSDDDSEIAGFLLTESNPELNNFTTRARGNIRLDARTQTDFGLIRAFIDFEMTVGPSASSNPDEEYGDTTDALGAAFIQISSDMGTFTAGHTGSFFDFFGSYGFGGTRLDIDDNTTEQTLFAYTFGGGNGFSATLSVEDPASSNRRRESGAIVPVLIEDYEGQESPDLVGNIRLDQGWGAAQLMGVVGQIHDNDPDIDGEEDEIGWAVGAGVRLGFGMFEASAQGGYSEGRIGYISTDPGGFGDFSDVSGFDLEPNEAWMVRAGIRAGFSPTLTGSVSGSYTHAERNDFDLGLPAFTGPEEYEHYAIIANVVWTPVPGLSMGPEFAYNHIDFDDDAEVGIIGPAAIDPFEVAEDDAWSVQYRVQRAF